MNTTATQPNNSRYLGLLRSLEGLRNGKAIALLLGSNVIAMMVFFIGASLGAFWHLLLFGLAAYAVSLVGASAAGGVLMDTAHHISPRSIGDAIVMGAIDLLKILGIFLVGLLAFIAYMIALAIILYICKIPGLGPVLYGLLLPVLVILSALVVNGLLVWLMLSNSAVWEGNSFRAALARVTAIASKRLPEVLISFLLLTLLMMIVGLIVGALMVTGYLLVAGMSASILGSSLSMSLGGLGAMGGLGGMEGEGMGYLKAAGFGSGVLFAVTVTAMMSVFLMGVNLIYLSACDGLDSAAIEGAFNERFQGVKQKAEEMQQRVRERAQEAQDRTRRAAAERSAPSATVVPQARCPNPKCNAVVNPGDLFCEACGERQPA